MISSDSYFFYEHRWATILDRPKKIKKFYKKISFKITTSDKQVSRLSIENCN